MTKAPAIEATGLRKLYRSGIFKRRQFEALKGIDFTVNQGEIFGLLGPNGAGKTTFVKVLLGVIRKSDGDARVFSEKAGSRKAREMVGYLPEHLRMQPHLTARSALELYGNLSNVPNSVVRKRGDELLELVGLQDRDKESIKRYSKGMLQRLGLAQAMLHEPKLLILDEPTDGLDPRARADVRSILTKLKQEHGTTIFLNSHILQEVELVCDRVAILNYGELKYCGTVQGASDFAQSGGQTFVPQLQPAPQVVQDAAGTGHAPATSTAPAAPAAPAAQSNASRYWFELLATEQQVSSVIPREIVSQLHNSGGGVVRVELNIFEQGLVDQTVDALRANGISIVALSKQRASLEDAFLEILGREGNNK